MKWILSVLCWLSAIGVFYSMFFKLAPYVCTLIPAGQWQQLLKVAVYVVVAYIGGLGFPFVLIILGIFLVSKRFF